VSPVLPADGATLGVSSPWKRCCSPGDILPARRARDHVRAHNRQDRSGRAQSVSGVAGNCSASAHQPRNERSRSRTRATSTMHASHEQGSARSERRWSGSSRTIERRGLARTQPSLGKGELTERNMNEPPTVGSSRVDGRSGGVRPAGESRSSERLSWRRHETGVASARR
jgi:hypothetical protein